MSEKYLNKSWELSVEEARALQQKLRHELKIEPLNKKVKSIAGADISFNKYEKTVYAGIVVLDIQSLTPIAHSLAITEVHFPYIPGLLSFREIPALLEAWKSLELKPDAIMLDGHGIAHPRKMGIASHFGLLTDCPSVGVAKKKLVGNYEEPAAEAGAYTSLTYDHETLGYVYRSKKKVKPIFISPGHLLDFKNALEISKSCVGKYRLPEPTRQAHLLVNQLRKEEVKPGFQLYNETPLF